MCVIYVSFRPLKSIIPIISSSDYPLEKRQRVLVPYPCFHIPVFYRVEGEGEVEDEGVIPSFLKLSYLLKYWSRIPKNAFNDLRRG